jgi:hypothetical protein
MGAHIDLTTRRVPLALNKNPWVSPKELSQELADFEHQLNRRIVFAAWACAFGAISIACAIGAVVTLLVTHFAK